MAAIILGALALSIIWVGIDASDHDFSEAKGWYWRTAVGWTLACIVLWIAYFPLYLSARRKVPLKSEREASRPCTRCGERVANGVLDCPHCGFDFRTIGATPNTE
jgi:hypothetical protein